ncbi:hypothetical protein G3N58_02925 [Paraburkholderia sp. Ac-20342]|uniref:RNase A-like domain-containing protein n=2 Tax=Paraburkholderia TaxID=1822464 RepID=UPI00141ED2CE|nr:hypothetical protein [Paraburkholderia sp. Ac-20342]NIF76958.1 hypothetical protein [Paraburkholderia sp. Cy-641]
MAIAAAKSNASQAMHEAKALNPELGGHTLKHVDKDEAWLKEQLRRGPYIPAASSFTDIRQAEWAIAEAMRANVTKIETWATVPRHDLVLFDHE